MKKEEEGDGQQREDNYSTPAEQAAEQMFSTEPIQ